MIRSLFIVSLITVLACTGDNTTNIKPEEKAVKTSKTNFQSKLFKTGTLIYSDDFDGEFNRNYWGAPSRNKVIKDGLLIHSPKFKTKEEAMKKLKRDHHLGLGVVAHLNKIPKKYVLHMRFKFVTDAIVPGRPSFQIGHHMISLGFTKEGGYRLGLPGEQRKWFSEPNATMKINEWVDLVIEYQQGKIHLNVNGHGRTYEHEQVTMDNKKDKLGPRFSFKSKDSTEERLIFDYVRIWEAE